MLKNLPPEGTSFADDTTRIMLLCQRGKGKDKNGLFIGDFRQCIAWLTKAERISKKYNWNKGLMISNLYAGTWYGWKGNSLQGLQKKQRAVYHAELENNPFWLARAYRQLGDSYALLKNYDQAIHYLTLALGPSQKSEFTTYLIVTQNLGVAYLGKKDYKNASKWLEKSYLLCLESKNQQMLKYVILNWAEVCLAAKNVPKLNTLLNQYPAVKFEDKAWDVRYYALNAQRYLLENEPTKALKALNLGLPLLTLTSDEHRQALFLQFSRVYERLGNTDKALSYFKQYSALWEKDVRSFQEKQTEYLEYEYKSQKQEDSIKILHKDAERQKLISSVLWAGIILSILFVIFLIWNRRVSNRKTKVIENQRNELLLLEKKLSNSNQQLIHFNEELEQKVTERTQKLLEANQELTRKNQQISEAFVSGKTLERKRVASELHDNLGSTISGLIWQLQSVMPENLLDKEQEIYEGLIQQMRNAYTEIRHISHHLVPVELEKGLEAALKRLFTDLNSNRNIDFQILGHYPAELLTKEQETEIYSICLELINNTLKHSESTQCLLEFSIKAHGLEIIFTDNGKGFDPNQLKGRGQGLANIKERVESLNGTLLINSQHGHGVRYIISLN
ncbi:tetratricopeptide repeat-containing sensor histidine kinase [Dyadobacter sp. 3J3]|uniref:tetratricopeptide repeat-containing sensor histidine kinase n=1 Tax=Dyadobacter sp. 3J3 TaxID=2606600 RepID=UPI001356B0C8|nr:tetratricopeptide repeat-containing sensor histidine kinase [Dyadobacter sp. 3J3]